MKALTVRWEQFFYRSVHPHSFAVLRIGFAVFLMLYWFTQWMEARLFSSEYGILIPKLLTDSALTSFLLHPPLWYVHAFFFVIFLLLIFLLLGIRTRTVAASLLILSVYYYLWHQWLFMTSYYRLFLFSLGIFLLPGADRALSFRMWQKHGSMWAWEPMQIYPLRLIGLQLSATYLGVGWQKLWLPGWETGKVLINSFTSRWGTELGFWFVRVFPPEFFDWLIRLTIWLEITMPFGLWIRKVQWIFFLGGFVFHTLITIGMEIWWFQIMIPMYIVFLPTEDIFRWLRARTHGRIPMRPAR